MVPPSIAVQPALVSGIVALPSVLAETNLQMTNDLVWVMTALAVGGAIITYAFLVYAIAKFRDPKMKGRRYG